MRTSSLKNPAGMWGTASRQCSSQCSKSLCSSCGSMMWSLVRAVCTCSFWAWGSDLGIVEVTKPRPDRPGAIAYEYLVNMINNCRFKGRQSTCIAGSGPCPIVCQVLLNDWDQPIIFEAPNASLKCPWLLRRAPRLCKGPFLSCNWAFVNA